MKCGNVIIRDRDSDSQSQRVVVFSSRTRLCFTYSGGFFSQRDRLKIEQIDRIIAKITSAYKCVCVCDTLDVTPTTFP